ncbi:MAG: flagellar export protein FliJ [Thermodesulfobacteriota bacterium]
MKPFSFRLDRIRRYRNYREKEAQIALAKAKSEQRELQEAENRLGSERIEAARRCRNEVVAGISVPVYLMYGAFLARLSSEIDDTHVGLKQAEKNVKSREAALLQESVSRKALERLRELKYKRYTKNQDREEQKILDELVLLRRGNNP